MPGTAQNRTVLGKLIFEDNDEPISNVELYVYQEPSIRTHSDTKGVFQLELPQYLLMQDSVRIVIRFDDLHQPTGFMAVHLDTTFILLPRPYDIDYTSFIVRETVESNESTSNNDTNAINPSNNTDAGSKILVKMNGKLFSFQEESFLAGLNTDSYSLQQLTEIFQNLDSDFQNKHLKVIDGLEQIQSKLSKSLILNPSQIELFRHNLDSLEKELNAIKQEFREKGVQYKVLVQKAQKEIEELQKLLVVDSNFVRVHRYLYYSIITILSLLFLLLLVFVYMFVHLHKRRRELIQRNQTIDEQNQEILLINEELATQRDKLEHQSERLRNYLEEIHHRIKNHLQRTSSLLDLSMTSGLPTEQVIENIRRRIYSMALIHKKLQNTENLDQVNLKEYLEELINSISETLNSPDKEIQCITHIAPLLLGHFNSY